MADTTGAQVSKATDYVREFPAKPEQMKDLRQWLHQIYEYVEAEARSAVDWYTRHSGKKKTGSLIFRYSAIVFGGLAGLLPIFIAVLPQGMRDLSPIRAEQASLFVSLLVGFVALFIALDRFGDFSAGWMRYMLTAFNIRKELQEFRMDWAHQLAEMPKDLDMKAAMPLIERAKQFVLKIEGYIGDETRQWASEFQQNLKQMETEISKKIEEREKQTEQQMAAIKPGALELSVANAEHTDDQSFTVQIEPGKIKEQVVGAQSWVKTGLTPGIHTITVSGMIGSHMAAESKAVTIVSNEVLKVQMTLFVPQTKVVGKQP